MYSATGRRSYFSDVPKVAFTANREHIRILEVDGHAGIVVVPGVDQGPHFFAAVQRWPGNGKPGILVAGGVGTPSFDAAIAQVRQALAE